MTAQRPLARNDVVLVTFPFTDLSREMLRPALIVGRVTGNDVVLAFITSRTGKADGRPVDRSEHLVTPTDPEFVATGLRAASVIRLNKLATLNQSLIRRRIGRIGAQTERAVASCLRHVFEL